MKSVTLYMIVFSSGMMVNVVKAISAGKKNISYWNCLTSFFFFISVSVLLFFLSMVKTCSHFRKRERLVLSPGFWPGDEQFIALYSAETSASLASSLDAASSGVMVPTMQS